MTYCKTVAADFRQADSSQFSGFAIARRSIRKAILRYLRWRAVTQLRQVDPRMLKEFGVNTEIILSTMHRLEIGDTP